MAWPSGTKAGTTNVDAGSDKPALARPDIKQNIDNVNSIIDTFDIASPSNGDILVYNSTSGAWEPSASSGGSSVAMIYIGSGEELVSGSIYRAEVTELFDSQSIVSLNGSYQFTLDAGTYLIEVDNTIVDENEATFDVYNETDSQSEGTFQNFEMGTTGFGLFVGAVTFTIDGTKNFSFRQDNATITNRNSRPRFTITK